MTSRNGARGRAVLTFPTLGSSAVTSCPQLQDDGERGEYQFTDSAAAVPAPVAALLAGTGVGRPSGGLGANPAAGRRAAARARLSGGRCARCRRWLPARAGRLAAATGPGRRGGRCRCRRPAGRHRRRPDRDGRAVAPRFDQDHPGDADAAAPPGRRPPGDDGDRVLDARCGTRRPGHPARCRPGLPGRRGTAPGLHSGRWCAEQAAGGTTPPRVPGPALVSGGLRPGPSGLAQLPPRPGRLDDDGRPAVPTTGAARGGRCDLRPREHHVGADEPRRPRRAGLPGSRGAATTGRVGGADGTPRRPLWVQHPDRVPRMGSDGSRPGRRRDPRRRATRPGRAAAGLVRPVRAGCVSGCRCGRSPARSSAGRSGTAPPSA